MFTDGSCGRIGSRLGNGVKDLFLFDSEYFGVGEENWGGDADFFLGLLLSFSTVLLTVTVYLCQLEAVFPPIGFCPWCLLSCCLFSCITFSFFLFFFQGLAQILGVLWSLHMIQCFFFFIKTGHQGKCRFHHLLIPSPLFNHLPVSICHLI